MNFHNNFNPEASGKDRYMTFTDYLGHKDLGEKTMLFIIDGFYGSKTVSGIPSLKWKIQPFNDRWPSSIFVSQDGVAIDAVGIDFLRSEWPDLPDSRYCEKYLFEASMADNPPSGTFYDPERDKIRCNSLGVFESWNNQAEKKYSRNLGKNYGIELHMVDLSGNTGLFTENQDYGIVIYPNPAGKELIIKNCSCPAVVRVFDIHGRLCIQTTLTEKSIDISMLPQGSYIVRINEKDNYTVKEFIKI